LANSTEFINILKQLGLTLNEARVFCALSGVGKSTAKAISKSSGIAREIVYQVLPSLQKKGLVEEIVASPKLFKALSMGEAFDVMLSQRTRENAELREKAVRTLERWQDTTNFEDDSHIVVIPPRQEDSHWKSAWYGIQETVDMIIPLSKFLQWPQHHAEAALDEVVKRKVRMRIITDVEVQKVLLSPPEGFSLNLVTKLKHVNFKFMAASSLVELTIFDGKKGFVCTNKVSQMKDMMWLFTDNPFILEVEKNYFETVWSSSGEESKRRDC
jgi:sugar-specific transcriptional regulator TrmB